MSTGDPLVSVIVPAFNAGATLGQTLQSVAGQSYSNIEVVIVNDGSTDRTEEIAASYCREDGRARVVTQQNCGLPAARNAGIVRSTGDWIAPVDADDIWHPTKIEKQVRLALAQAEAPAFVYCWFRHIDGSNRVVGSGPRVQLNGRAFAQLAYLNAVGNGSSLLISREVLNRTGLYDEGLRACEDVEFQLRLARNAPIGCVPEHLVGYRIHQGNMSRDLRRIVDAWDLVYARLAGEGVPSLGPVIRWNQGKRAYEDAQAKVLSGQFAAAIPYLLRSLAGDPFRCGALIGHRIARRLLRRRQPEHHPIGFYEMDPADSGVAAGPNATPDFFGLLGRLDRRRLERLARLDASTA